MPRTKKNHISQNEDPRFHNTYQFLKHYRDATYSLKVVVHQLETQFQIDYGTSIDHFLDSIYAAGADLNGSDIEGSKTGDSLRRWKSGRFTANTGASLLSVQESPLPIISVIRQQGRVKQYL